jgi:hypothetical protein
MRPVSFVRAPLIGLQVWETNIEMIATLFRREFASFLDKIPELGLSSLEFSRLVTWRHPVCDFLLALSILQSASFALSIAG